MINNTNDHHNDEDSLDDQLTNEDILLSKYNEIWITHQQFIDSVTRLSKPEISNMTYQKENDNENS